MRSLYQSTVFGIMILVSCSGCNQIFKNYVNKRYPPVSSLQKSAASVQNQIQALQNLPKIGLGVQLNKGFLDTLIKTFFRTQLAKDTNLGIRNVGQIRFVTPPSFTLGQQEVLVSSTIQLFDIQNKYLKEVEFSLNGRIAPSVLGDSILLDPSFSQVHVQHLQLRKWIILGGLARSLVNALLKSYMDNVNGALRSFAVEVHYPPIPDEPLSQLLGSDDHLKVVRDDTFHIRPRRLSPVILIDTGHIDVMADVVVDTAMTWNNAPMKKLRQLAPAEITPRQFEALFQNFDSAYKKSWNLYLDTLTITDAGQGQLCVSYAILSDMMNELWAKTDLALSYDVSYRTDFPLEQIKLAEISQPDCGNIKFDFQPNDCSKVFSDCGTCGFFDVLCHARWLICQTANGAKYTACQTANAAKLAAASAEWIAQKGLCYTEVAAIFIVNNLVLSVGSFKGAAGIDGLINGTLTHTVPGGIESLGLEANIQANGKANVWMLFVPSGAVGLLLCSLPEGLKITDKPVQVNAPAFTISATTEKITDGDKCVLRVHTGDLHVPIDLGRPLIIDILEQPLLTLNCQVGVFLGTLIASALDLTHNQHFKNYLDAIFGGTYTWSLHKDLNVPLPAIPISSGDTKFRLTPGWGKNSLIFIKK